MIIAITIIVYMVFMLCPCLGVCISVISSFATYIYSEKQLKDIKILLTFYHLGIQFLNKLFLSLIKLPLCNSPKLKIEIHGSLVTIQYYTKCTNPLYPKFTSKKFSALNLCCNLYQAMAYVLIPTTDKS